ncbi:MAG: hypothetical protein WC708_12450 [Lentisphaeria bacterium]
MVYDPAIHHRRSIRLPTHDYAAGGLYYVTLSTAGRRRLFGTVVNGRMAVNEAGRAVRDEWLRSAAIRAEIALDEWVVMPDHFHAIVMIRADGPPTVRATGRSPTTDGPPTERATGRSPLRQFPSPPACIISGFLSPLERAVFDEGLVAAIPMVWVLACGLPGTFPPRLQGAIDAGRLLVITPFAPAVAAVSTQRAAWCSQYVLHAAATVVIGHLAPDGMLACLLADLPEDRPIHFFPS